MSFKFNLLLEVKRSIKAAANKPCFLQTQRAAPSGGAVPPASPPLTSSLRWTCIKVAFVWQRAGQAYPYYPSRARLPRWSM
ncbi:hypothetical protein CesoFtcFv8_017255 [Champsocephalus esox]|uniref:Uncharacterized protein n=1 Tax=Champsocephalus esox TaxID=159716 RepID=A0AAN8BKH6_9TELE|nr:hypothetical protein CesoFtcFv8_017255 [Champsocephalus esox]